MADSNSRFTLESDILARLNPGLFVTIVNRWYCIRNSLLTKTYINYVPSLTFVQVKKNSHLFIKSKFEGFEKLLLIKKKYFLILLVRLHNDYV